MNLNIAARAGRWSAAHWKTAVSTWLAFCIVAIALGAVAGTKMLKQADTAAGGTKTAEQILRDAGFPDRAGESVLVQSRTQSIGDPAFRADGRGCRAQCVAAAAGSARALAARSGELRARSRRTGARRSSSSRSAATWTRPTRRCSRSSTPSTACSSDMPGFTVAEFGFASATHELNNTLSKDFKRAEYSSLPVTLVILLVAFGALVAAGLPVLLAFSGVLATIGLSALASHVVAAGERDAIGDLADRDGGRGRLLALLPSPRARGAGARPLAPGVRC